MDNDLISRSALLGEFTKKDDERAWAVGLGYVQLKIKEAPAVDAVEVVRCKECKHWDKEPDEREGCCFGIADGTMLTEPDEFCSRGERRGEG